MVIWYGTETRMNDRARAGHCDEPPSVMSIIHILIIHIPVTQRKDRQTYRLYDEQLCVMSIIPQPLN